MNIFLSCGPIIEPLVGMAFSGIICVFLFIFFLNKAKKSDFYQSEFIELSTIKQFAHIIFFLSTILCFLTIIFFILYFKISQYKKYVMYFRNTKSYKFQKCCITKYFLLKILTIKLLLQKYKKTKKKSILSITVYK